MGINEKEYEMNMKPTIEIDLNDATFLGIVLDKWIIEAEIIPTERMKELSKRLKGE
jgi:hypothetical protein